MTHLLYALRPGPFGRLLVTAALCLAALVLPMLLMPALFPALAGVAEAGAEAKGGWNVLLWLNTTQGLLFSLAALWILREAARRYIASQQLQDDDVVRKYLMDFLDIAVSATFARLSPSLVLATASGNATAGQIQVRELEVRRAAEGVLATVGDAAKHFGISQEGLQDRISRRLDAKAADLAAGISLLPGTEATS